MNRIKAEIIADSLNRFGNRLTTFVVTFPRIVLAELNTHRMFSRNSASSRAIPFKRMLEIVETEPFIPIKWMKEHRGMQGNKYFDGSNMIGYLPEDGKPDVEWLEMNWLKARDSAVEQAKILSLVGLTKQVCNRLLEPFLYHTAIITSSEWENFFALRAHPDAEIHIADLAQKMLDVYNESEPKQLQAGEWHIPFGDNIGVNKPIFKREVNPESILEWIPMQEVDGDWVKNWRELEKVKIATARCARVSYLNFEGKDDYAADIKLHDQLLSSGHMSPMEHCARAMTDKEYYSSVRGRVDIIDLSPDPSKLAIDINDIGWSGNFRGFVQYRKTLQNENRTDSRVVRK